jgi:hypothetical protein
MKVTMSDEEFDRLLTALTSVNKDGSINPGSLWELLEIIPKLDTLTEKLVELNAVLSDEPEQEYVITARAKEVL